MGILHNIYAKRMLARQIMTEAQMLNAANKNREVVIRKNWK